MWLRVLQRQRLQLQQQGFLTSTKRLAVKMSSSDGSSNNIKANIESLSINKSSGEDNPNITMQSNSDMADKTAPVVGLLSQFESKLSDNAAAGNIEAVNSLLQMKGMDTNVNWKNDRGWTALMLAARNDHLTVVRTLIEHGTDVNIMNTSGQTALDVAKFWNHQDIVDILLGKSKQKDNSEFYNFYSQNPLYRAAEKRKDAEWLQTTMKLESTKFIVFKDLDPFIVPNETSSKKSLALFSYKQLASILVKQPLVIFLGLEAWNPKSAAWFAVDVSLTDESVLKDVYEDGAFAEGYRSTMALQNIDAGIFAEARSVLAWHDRYMFCPSCGATTAIEEAGYKRSCSDLTCRSHNGVHNTNHPRVDPSLIMLVVSPEGKRCLLGRKKSFSPKMYSCLAGYMEPGESLEACCRREVQEESGVKIGKIEYHSSQPWPFPAVIMLGCLAYAKTDSIQVDMDELEDAKWFTRNDVAAMANHKHPKDYFFPPAQAIAHQLIKHWLNTTGTSNL